MYLSFAPIALLALPTIVAGVSLANFPPYLSGLPISCAIVYRQPIIGCSTSDFGPDGCSAGCVRKLQEMVPAVDAACANHNINGQNVIVAFLANAGPQSVCRNADEILSSSGVSSTSAAPSTSSTAASSTSERTTSATLASSDSTTATSQSQTASPQTTSSTVPMASLLTTTTASSLTMDVSSSSSTALPTTSSVESSQTGEDDGSGGGSPFDSPGNMESAAALASCAFSISLFTVWAMLLAVLR